MEIRVICIGKIKEPALTTLITKYSKKIEPFMKFKIIELPEVTFSSESEELIKKTLTTEAQYIEPYLKQSYNVVLAIEGKNISSEELSQKCHDVFTNASVKYMNFIIGSSHGLDQRIKDMADLSLSFSKMTFPHQLMRLILVEQIYRALSIIKNTKYHK